VTSPLIRVSNLTKRYRVGGADVDALCDIDLEISEGEFVAIMGPSGSGKTTLLNLLGVLDCPTRGNYLLGNEDVSRLDERQRARTRNRKIGFVFQAFNLLPRSTAIENVELPLIYRGISKSARRKSAEIALTAVDLANRQNHWPLQLSGGEQQRVAIARALVTDPLLILADEPTGALDSRTGKDVLHQLQRLHTAGRTIILVTHDQQVARHARRIVTFRDGRIVNDEEVGRVSSLRRDADGPDRVRAIRDGNGDGALSP
jgi:putative ABC transport system ATP-binding protein